jgi:hypothetical protein
MSAARVGHTATWLQNGKVLVLGGNVDALNGELYDPASNAWSAIADGTAVATPPRSQIARDWATTRV